MGDATETLSIEDCAKKFNEHKNNFFASKDSHSDFVQKNSTCTENSLTKNMTQVRNWSEVVITKYQTSVAPSYTGLSTGSFWILMFIVVLIVFVVLVFFVKFKNRFKTKNIQKMKSENENKLLKLQSKYPKCENVYVCKTSRIDKEIDQSFEHRNCIESCHHTSECPKSKNKVTVRS